MNNGLSTFQRACGAFVITLFVGITGLTSGDGSFAQSSSKATKKSGSSSSQYITVRARTMPQAFTLAHKQGAKITGCWLQKDKTWKCQAKKTKPVETTTTIPPFVTIPTTKPAVTTTKPVTTTTKPATTTTQPVVTTTKPPTTTTPPVVTTAPPVTTPPGPSGSVPGRVGPTSTNLTTMNGLTITQHGAVISGVNVIGQITVKANNVTIRNFRANNVYKDPGFGGMLLEDGEIHGQQNNRVNGVVWSDYTARRLNIYNVDDAFKAHGNVLIENVWVHDLAFFSSGGSWTHNDGVQVSSGSNVTVRNSRFERIQGTAAVFIKPDQGSISNVTIHNNILGGGAYTLYSQSKNGSNPTNINITNNTFLNEKIYGSLYVDNPNTFLSGNVNHLGQPIG